jgi:hypothetical protein
LTERAVKFEHVAAVPSSANAGSARQRPTAFFTTELDSKNGQRTGILVTAKMFSNPGDERTGRFGRIKRGARPELTA